MKIPVVSVVLFGMAVLVGVSNCAPPSSAAVTEFDGEYARTATKGIDGCRGFGPRTLTIKNGKVFAEENPQTSFVFEGSVAEDGKLLAYGRNSSGTSGMRLSGQITDGVFKGKSSGLNCDFEVSMQKKGAVPSGVATKKFDGKYQGMLTPIGSCGRSSHRTVNIKNGMFRFVANKKTSLTFTGPLGEDGSVVANGSNDNGAAGVLSGRVSADTFEGQTNGLYCDFKLSLQKQEN